MTGNWHIFWGSNLTEDRLANSIPAASVRPFALMTQVILPSRRISSGLRSQAMFPQLKRIPDFRLICDTRRVVYSL